MLLIRKNLDTSYTQNRVFFGRIRVIVYSVAITGPVYYNNVIVYRFNKILYILLKARSSLKEENRSQNSFTLFNSAYLQLMYSLQIQMRIT